MLAAKRATTATGPLRTAQLLTVMAVVLMAVACLGGLFVQGIYRFEPKLVPATQGQDLVTLLFAVPGAICAMVSAKRGSMRGAIAWVGFMGYITYSFIGAAFAYNFNQLFLVYVSGFSLSVFAVINAIGSIDLAAIQQHFDAKVPHRLVAAFLVFMAIMLSLLWLGQIVPNLSNPNPVEIEPFKYVYALDLGLIVPLSLLGAIWLLRRVPWGYLLSGMMLVKAGTMGLALLAMQIFNLQVGQPIDPMEMVATYSLIAFGGVGLSVWFFRHCR